MKNKKILVIISLMLVCPFAFAACAPASGDAPIEEPAATPGVTAATEAPAQPPSEEPTQLPPDEPTPENATPAPAKIPEDSTAVTLTTSGTIQEVLDGGNQIHVLGENDVNPANDIIANISDDTVVIDAQTGDIASDYVFSEGETVELTVSSAMTKSLPPISNAYMVVVNIGDDMLGLPTYIIVNDVEKNEDGSVILLNQNKDTYVTIPAELELQAIDVDGNASAEKVSPYDLKTSDIVLAWYDFVALSYPAQATATQASIIIPN